MENTGKAHRGLGKLLNDGLLKKWYPLVLDRECGGYFTNITSDWTLAPGTGKDDCGPGTPCLGNGKGSGISSRRTGVHGICTARLPLPA